jgi:quinol monooxygenase YgiN
VTRADDGFDPYHQVSDILDKMIEPFPKLQEETRREPGCMSYFVQRSGENPRRYLVY